MSAERGVGKPWASCTCTARFTCRQCLLDALPNGAMVEFWAREENKYGRLEYFNGRMVEASQ